MDITQDEMNFDAPTGPRITVAFKRGALNLCAYYEGDLAIVGSIGARQFSGKPLNLCFSELLHAYIEDVNVALKRPDPKLVADQLLEAYRKFTDAGKDLHRLAAKTVCTDGSRLTTAFGLCCNYLYTVLHLARVVMGESQIKTPHIQIDEHLGGLDEWDGLGIGWGFAPQSKVSRVQRTDLSRGKTYLASQTKPRISRTTSRIDELVALIQGRKVDIQTPSSVYMPLADAIRTTPQDVVQILTQGIASLRQAVLDAERRKAEER